MCRLEKFLAARSQQSLGFWQICFHLDLHLFLFHFVLQNLLLCLYRGNFAVSWPVEARSDSSYNGWSLGDGSGVFSHSCTNLCSSYHGLARGSSVASTCSDSNSYWCQSEEPGPRLHIPIRHQTWSSFGLNEVDRSAESRNFLSNGCHPELWISRRSHSSTLLESWQRLTVLICGHARPNLAFWSSATSCYSSLHSSCGKALTVAVAENQLGHLGEATQVCCEKPKVAADC